MAKDLDEQIVELKEDGHGYRVIAQRLGLTERQTRLHLQRLRDEGRIKRASERKELRAEAAVQALQEGVVEALEAYGDKLAKLPRKEGKLLPHKPVGVVHLSDHHLNELINIPSNRYDFDIASKRLRLLASKVRHYCKKSGCERIVLAFGGDLLNSDRRVDEVLSQATNRSRAAILAMHLYEHFVRDLRKDFFLDLFGITGNEGRAKQELSWSEPAVSDSYDASIYWMLQTVLERDTDPGLRVHDLRGNEAVFSVHGETFLLLHGHQVKMHDQKAIQAIVGKYARQNVRVTYIIAGHIHSALVSDMCGRNSSLCGGNAYSDEALNFASKASQNLYIVHSGKCVRDATPAGMDGIKIDLQNPPSSGYPILKELARHDARSLRKATQARLNKGTTKVITIT